jgi:hypothetical protein
VEQVGRVWKANATADRSTRTGHTTRATAGTWEAHVIGTSVPGKWVTRPRANATMPGTNMVP